MQTKGESAGTHLLERDIFAEDSCDEDYVMNFRRYCCELHCDHFIIAFSFASVVIAIMDDASTSGLEFFVVDSV